MTNKKTIMCVMSIPVSEKPPIQPKVRVHNSRPQSDTTLSIYIITLSILLLPSSVQLSPNLSNTAVGQWLKASNNDALLPPFSISFQHKWLNA